MILHLFFLYHVFASSKIPVQLCAEEIKDTSFASLGEAVAVVVR